VHAQKTSQGDSLINIKIIFSGIFFRVMDDFFQIILITVGFNNQSSGLARTLCRNMTKPLAFKASSVLTGPR